ncbi:hypothetical protein [Kutzneria sp. NPDC051319]
MSLDPRQWAYGTWWTRPTDGRDPEPLNPQPPAPITDAAGNVVVMPPGW